MTHLDRTSPVPLWAQLHDELRRRLDAGEFDVHFPTDQQLVTRYGVSRQTVREAVRRLAEAGLLDRERGRGTTVRPAVRQFEYLGGSLDSLHEQIEAQGAEQRSVVLTQERAEDRRVARRLELPDHAELVHISRLRLADGEPVALDDAWLSAAIGAPLLAADLTATGIYPELRTAGIEVDGGTEHLAPVLPTPAERATLHLPRGTAAFAIERLARQGGRAIEWRRTLIRGDRYRITLNLARGRAQPAVVPWSTRDPR